MKPMQGTPKKHVVRAGLAGATVLDYGAVISVVDLVVPEGSRKGVAVEIGSKIMQIAAGRDVWCAVDLGNDRMVKFLSTAGFQIKYVVMSNEQS